MAEAQVGLCESGVPRLYGGDANSSLFVYHVARKDFFRHGHRALVGFDRRQEHLLLHARHIEWKKSTVFDDLSRNFILARRELAERNFLTAANPINQGKIRRGQHSKVLAILLVDTLDVFGNHDADSRTHFRIRRLFPTRSFAPSFAADGTDKTATLYVTAPDGRDAPALQPEIGNLAQRLVKIKTVMRWGDLVRRDVVTQFGVIRGMTRIPWKVLPRKLSLDQIRIFGEKKNSPLQPDLVRPFVDVAC